MSDESKQMRIVSMFYLPYFTSDNSHDELEVAFFDECLNFKLTKSDGHVVDFKIGKDQIEGIHGLKAVINSVDEITDENKEASKIWFEN